MTKIENGQIVMDDIYAPKNSQTKLKEKVAITKYVVIEAVGHLEDHIGMILERNEEFEKFLKENSGVNIIAEGECYCSLSEFIYAVQSPTRQLYRATMADIKELLEGRFINDDEYMRTVCNEIDNEGDNK